MKIRNGFVSNSSSSSFLVIFPKEPKSLKDVRDILFDSNEEYYFSPYGNDKYPVEKVVNTVYKDICNQEKNDLKTAIEILMSDFPVDYSFYGKKNIDWNQFDIDSKKYAENKLKDFFNIRKLKLKKINNEDVKDFVLYNFSYSDESSYGAALENGGLFSKLKNIKINKH